MRAYKYPRHERKIEAFLRFSAEWLVDLSEWIFTDNDGTDLLLLATLAKPGAIQTYDSPVLIDGVPVWKEIPSTGRAALEIGIATTRI